MQLLKGYPAWFFPLLLVVMFVLLGTGVVLIPTMLEMRLDLDSPVSIGRDLRLLSAASHTTMGFLVLALIGAVLAIHVRIGWRVKLNRISGVGLLALFAIMLLTGLGMFYVGGLTLSRACSIVHLGAGILSAFLLGWHIFKGLRMRR